MDPTLLNETDLDLDYRGYIDIKACANGQNIIHLLYKSLKLPSLSDLPIIVPMDVRNERPMPSDMSDLLAPEVKRDPHHQHRRRDASHSSVCILVARHVDPWVRVE